MRNNVLKIYDVFYDMVYLTTMLSNDMDEALEKDAKKIIRFIGEAYQLNKEIVKECEDIIINEISVIATTKDAETFSKSPDYDILNPDLSDMYSIKCDVLMSMANIIQGNNGNRWFDYSHVRPYSPEMRYVQIKKTAIARSLEANKLAAIMEYLGIGVEIDVESAIVRLQQCSIWGDVISINLLKTIFKKIDDPRYEIYDGLTKLEKYLAEGRTILPLEVKDKVKEETRQLFAIISSIRQDIIYAQNIYAIDYSFVEVMLLPNVDYYKKLYFINLYGIDNREWKEITNSSDNPRQRFGFMPRRER